MTNDNQFPDGEAYERSVGVWSRLTGAAFLQLLDPATGAAAMAPSLS